MITEAITNTCTKHFDDEICQAEKLPTVFDNAPVDDTEPLHQQPKTAVHWARFAVRSGEGLQVTTGPSRRFRYVGVAIATVMAPLNQGTGKLNQIADKICEAFTGKTVDSVVFRTAYATVAGQVGSWWQVTVTCPFYADKVHTP